MTTLVDTMKDRIGYSHFFDEKRGNRSEYGPSRSMLREHNGGIHGAGAEQQAVGKS
jgi:hypothetical protein